MDHEIEVPPFFVCPISLEIMKDPVTVSTGITYERDSIEKWLFAAKNNTCPVTKQPLTSSINDVTNNVILTPNHTLRRLIQSWCTLNSSHGIERIPTPKSPVTKSLIQKLLKDYTSNSNSPHSQIQCLKSLKTIASESESNKRCIESSGAVDFLATIITSNTVSSLTLVDSEEGFEFKTGAEDEALSILHNLSLSENGLKSLLGFKNGEFVDSLIRVMQRGNYDSRTYAVLLLKSIADVANPVQLVNIGGGNGLTLNLIFVELVQILKDQVSNKATKATLQALSQLVPLGRNRVKAVEAGAVPVLVEILLDCKERKLCEMVLVVLEMLCQCADGRAELLGHGAGLAIVSKKILRVSTMANDRAVRILLSVSRYSATKSVVHEMLQLGVVAKLCLVVQVDSGNKAKEKAREILKLHARDWRNSSCLPSNLLASYPTTS